MYPAFIVAVLVAVTACAGPVADPREPKATLEGQSAPVADNVGPVQAPVVVGEIPIMSSAPDAIDALRSEPPQRLVIDDLDLAMPVVDVGLATDGSMEIPESAAVAGWYRFGPAPGAERGNAVLAAHVDDATIGLGPFSRLRDLEPGTSITVTDATGEVLLFEVSRVDQTSKREVDMGLIFDRDADSQLVLVTCGGRFDWDAGHYEDNVVVFATPVENRS